MNGKPQAIPGTGASLHPARPDRSVEPTCNAICQRLASAAIVGKSRLLKLGKSLAVGEVSLYSEGGDEPVAHVVGTYSIPPSARQFWPCSAPGRRSAPYGDFTFSPPVLTSTCSKRMPSPRAQCRRGLSLPRTHDTPAQQSH